MSASFRAQRSENSLTGPSYLWEVAGKPVSVRISLETIEKLDHLVVETFRSVSARGSEIGGVLLGSCADGDPATVCVEGFEAVTCDYSRGPLYRLSDADKARFDEAIERLKGAGGPQPVGFFRSHTRRALALDTDDLAFLQTRFQDPRQIALVVRPFATKASSAGIFIWEDGGMRTESSYLEFPFQASQLGASNAPAARAGASAPAPVKLKVITRSPVTPAPRFEVAAPMAAPQPAPPQPAAPQASQVVAPRPAKEPPAPVKDVPPAPAQRASSEREPEPEPEPKTTLPDPAPAAAAASIPAKEEPPSAPVTPPAFLEFEEPVSGGDEKESLPQRVLRAPKWVWGVVAAVLLACSGVLFVYPGLLRKSTRPMIPLTLRIERTAADLLLTWNRDSDAIRSARHAVLTISDGDRQENYQMDLAQLRTGSIVYSPVTPDVSFKMEVTGQDQSTIASELVRVLRTRPSPMAETAAPASPQTPSAAAPAAAATEQAQKAETAAEAEEEEEAPQLSRAGAPSRPFNVASLSSRLRPAAAADMPEAPSVGGVGSGSAGGPVNLGAISAPRISPMAPAPAPAPKQEEGTQLRPAQLVSRKDPVFPALAKQAGVAGSVRLVANIGTDGRVKDVKVVSGNVLLQRAAIDAVKQWIYRPPMLNGVAVEGQSDIVLNFTR